MGRPLNLAGRAPARRKPPGRKEEMAQVGIFQWAAWIRLPPSPDISERARLTDYLYAIPNGGHRHPKVAAELKAQGVKAGVSDMHLPLARGGYNGLWIELKVDKNRLSPHQEEWLARMRMAGYRAEAVWGAEAAKDLICDYLGIKLP